MNKDAKLVEFLELFGLKSVDYKTMETAQILGVCAILDYDLDKVLELTNSTLDELKEGGETVNHDDLGCVYSDFFGDLVINIESETFRLEKEFDIDSKLDLNSAEVKYSSKIELRNLSFKYENRDEFILNNTSLLIKKGYKVICSKLI